MSNVVKSHPLYSINEHDGGDDGPQYDWFTGTGADSDEWFESAEEAERDVRSYLGITNDVIILTKAEHDELLDYKFRYEGLNK